MDYFITSDNTKIYYLLSGKGLPIIFIHGFTANHHVFKIPQKLMSKKYKAISYDLRGHGLSSKSDTNISIDRLALDLRELIDHLNLGSVILVGWSLGVSIILEYINLFGSDRISMLCLVDMSPKVINDEDWSLGLYHGIYTIEDAYNDLDLIKNNVREFTEKFLMAMAPHFNKIQFNISLDNINMNSSFIMYLIWKSIIEKDYRNILKKIDIPTLILFGEKSTLYSLEVGKYLNKMIEYSCLHIFEDSTHLLVLENPIKFNRVLDEFINNKIRSL